MIIGFDVETTKAPRHFPWSRGSYLVCLSLARDDGVTKSWLFNHPDNDKPMAVSVSEIISEFKNAKRLVAHNIKFDLLWLLQYGFPIMPYRVYCTQVAEYLLRAQRAERGELTLEELSKHYGIPDKIDKVKAFWDSGYETDEIPSSILLPYCEQDCLNTLAIYQKQVGQLVRNKQIPLATLQFELAKTLATIEYNGMMVDRILISKYQQEYGEKIEEIDKELLKLLEEEAGVNIAHFNMASRDDVSAALYGGVCKYPDTEIVTRELKGGRIKEYERKCVREYEVKGLGFKPEGETAKEGVYKTDSETLKGLKCKTPAQRRFVSLIQERSKLAKLKGTYFDGLLDRMEEDGRVHPSLNQTIARTGRLTSSNPKQYWGCKIR